MENRQKAILLSEAIRLGAMIRPQAFSTHKEGEAGCALDCAYEAAYGSRPTITSWPEWYEAFPILSELVTAPCGCLRGMVKAPLGSKIVHLNDSHQWSRDEIADYVQTVEQSILARSTAQQSEQLVYS